jgi:hypothetical protein
MTDAKQADEQLVSAYQLEERHRAFMQSLRDDPAFNVIEPRGESFIIPQPGGAKGATLRADLRLAGSAVGPQCGT